ncbi:MAG: alanine--tRNA ligase [Candidatus Hydrogenedentes bacterium]|jgi:alanyl-tRNA synthetase|nr:alanine--tRNA ligase [Candidatus Hydrogenedentota bacterium]
MFSLRRRCRGQGYQWRTRVKTDDIRSSYLEFFRERGHVVERSDKIVPSNDPTLLFSSAGMVQFKPYYTGEVPVPYRRAATAQKCLRAGGKANDLDEVGKTARHMTFFEMMGNFSFGDYFKREAIQWAWEYSTQVVKIPAERIWVSVYEDDDEAAGIWETEIGIPPAKIVRLGAKDNFWGPAGDTGACGPCSELHLDRGETFGPGPLGAEGDARFMEYWNLVFPQFDQQPDGSRPPLQNRGIDTGMGLERMAAILQNKETVFDVDHIFPIIQHAESLAGSAYTANPVPFRVIADHIRALSFMIADGVLPGNEGRGYVERRLLRRAARFGREIGLEKPFLFELSRTVIDLMAHQYPELTERQIQIEKIIHTEEERFASTLARGMDILEETFAELAKTGSKAVPGAELFRLHDTFGFPLDLATDIAEDRGYTVDRDGFETAMRKQRELGRNAWAGTGEHEIAPIYRKLRDELGETQFVGYDMLSCEATIQALLRDGKKVQTLADGQEGEVVLDVSPFYAESGGQTGDLGTLESAGGSAHVATTRAPLENLRLHYAKVTQGSLNVGDTVLASVDSVSRAATACHHTATHLLQAALQETLGEHVHQAGSQVSPERLRFDFTHFEGIPTDRLHDIERLVNQYIRTDSTVATQVMPIADARAAGAMALFGEKYGDSVRVVQVDDISMELCGGTHVARTGVIGAFKILSESSISAGVRRIEAVCADRALDTIQMQEEQLTRVAQMLNASADAVLARVQAVMEENRRLSREVMRWKQAAATGGTVDYMSQVQDVDGVKLLAAEVANQDADGLRLVIDKLRDQLGSGIVVLASGAEDKAVLCVGVTKDLTSRAKAGDIVKLLAPIVGGGGGGRPDMAQAGGKHPEKIGEAIARAPEIVRQCLS